jgi:hypothetical protein
MQEDALLLYLPERCATVMETVMPDGTNNTETIVNADGSRTVTETVVRPRKV